MDSMTQTPRYTRYRLAIRRPVAMVMLFVTLIVFGWKSYQQLPVNLMPNISYPTLTVRTEYAGAAPEDVEKLVTRPLEETISIVSGLEEVSSSSSAGLSEITLEFVWGTDMNLALQEVRDRLDLFDPPKEVTEKPVILRYDPSLDPVLRVAVTGSIEPLPGDDKQSLAAKRELTVIREASERHVKSDLEAEAGIAQVLVKGGREQEILISVDAARLKSLGLSLQDVVNALNQQNINLSGGQLREGKTEYLVRTLNEFRDIAEIRNTLITAPQAAAALLGMGGGAMGVAGESGQREPQAVRLSDVAAVTMGEKERETIVHINGKEAVALDVYKEGDANTVQVCEHLKKALGFEARASLSDRISEAMTKFQKGGTAGSEDDSLSSDRLADTIRSRLPKGCEFTLISDQSRFIKGSIKEAQDSAIQGSIFAFLVVFLFLNHFTSTIIIGLAIPISLIATFIPMHMCGITLNVMSLSGLALAVGHLVDDSIIVLESIQRCREEGDKGLDAIERGVREILGADISTTLTNCVVFLPLAFVGGMAGQIFGHLGFTMTFSLLCSLLVALYLDPMLASLNRDWIRGQGTVLWMVRAYREARETETRGRAAAFARVLPISLRHARQWLVEVTRTTFQPTWHALRGGNPHWTAKKVLVALLHFVALPLVAAVYVIQLVLKLFSFLFLTLMFVLAGLAFGGWVLIRTVVKCAVWVPMQAFQICYAWSHYVYTKILRVSLQFGPVVLLVVAALAVESYYLSKQLGRELIPPLRQGEFTIRMEARPGTRLEETEQLAANIERVLLANPDVGSLGVEIGMEKTGTKTERGENIAQFNIVLKDPALNVGRQDEIIEALRNQVTAVSSEQVTFVLPTLFSFKTAIELQILGDDLGELRRVGQRVLDAIGDIPGFKDPELSIKKGYPEIIIELDRDLLSTKGITPIQVAQRLRTEIQGDIATRFSQGGEKIDVRVRSDQERLKAVADLRTISVVDGTPPIPLGSVANIRIQDGPSEIRRVDQRQVVMVRGNVEGFDLGTVTKEIEKRIAAVQKPSDYSFRFGGQNRELRTSFENLQLALLLSIFLVYTVMAIQFESLIQPALIMLTLPLAFIGVINVVYWLNMPLSVAVFMGCILLVGIVVDNSILLVDYANQLRARGRSKREAIYESGQVRFRPVLMTAVTTIVGTIPMAASGGEGVELRRPLAITVIAGLTLATVLTLVVIPVIYDMFGTRDKPGATP